MQRRSLTTMERWVAWGEEEKMDQEEMENNDKEKGQTQKEEEKKKEKLKNEKEKKKKKKTHSSIKKWIKFNIVKTFSWWEIFKGFLSKKDPFSIRQKISLNYLKLLSIYFCAYKHHVHIHPYYKRNIYYSSN